MATQDTVGALEAFHRYTQAFQALDARAVASHFDEPAFMISPHGISPSPNAAAVEALYGQVMAGAAGAGLREDGAIVAGRVAPG